MTVSSSRDLDLMQTAWPSQEDTRLSVSKSHLDNHLHDMNNHLAAKYARMMCHLHLRDAADSGYVI
jgi:hypothetical protein